MQVAELERFDARSVVWFRRTFGAALLASVAGLASSGVWRVHSGELYPWRHLPLLPLWPTWGLALEWALTALAGFAMLAGVGLRSTSRVAALVTLASVLERYSNHAALLFLVALFVALSPRTLEQAADDPHAFERARHPTLGLVRAQIVIVYVFGALNKAMHGFLSGRSLENLLHVPEGLARALSFPVVALELGIPILLALRPRAGIVAVFALHVVFSCILPGLVSFGLLMLAMAMLFWPRAGSERRDAP